MGDKIKKIKAREILDSRSWPTVEVELETSSFFVSASVPSGTSEGKYEALELRDGDKRYFGKGVLKAVQNINEIIGPKLEGKDVKKQKEIDDLMIELDGTENKSLLGANTIYGISLAVCRAGAKAQNLPLYKHIYGLSGNDLPHLNIPFPSFNILNGGSHAGNDLDIQEFMISPHTVSFSESLRCASEVYHRLKEILKKKYGELAANIGDEGGFAPPLKLTKEALDLISEAIETLGYQDKIKFNLDCAASQFFRKNEYSLENKFFSKEELLHYYFDLIQKYPITALEDPFAEDDWEGFQKITELIGGKILIIGDDLLVTNPKRIMEAKSKKACNGLLIKIDQIGTISEAIKAAKLAKSFGWKIMVSHRSGDTCDNFISDFAVGISADFIKAGAPARGERVAKYNRLLKIEEEL